MEVKGKLNLEVADRINELEELIKDFKLKREFFTAFFRGTGLDFDGYRDYGPEDDAGEIDWKASNRAQKLLVRKYIQEKNLKNLFLIDVGSNMVFGSTDKLKCEFIAELAAALSYFVMATGDKFAFLLFSDRIVHYVESRGGQKQFRLFISMLEDGKNYGGKTNLNNALDFAIDYLGGTIASVIFVSDFLNVDKDFNDKLKLFSKMFETLFIRVRDPLDISLPEVDKEVILEDPATHRQILINPKVAKTSYEFFAFNQAKRVEDIFQRNNVPFLDLNTKDSFTLPLAIYLRGKMEGKI